MIGTIIWLRLSTTSCIFMHCIFAEIVHYQAHTWEAYNIIIIMLREKLNWEGKKEYSFYYYQIMIIRSYYIEALRVHWSPQT